MCDAENREPAGGMGTDDGPRLTSSLWMVDAVQKEILNLDISP